MADPVRKCGKDFEHLLVSSDGHTVEDICDGVLGIGWMCTREEYAAWQKSAYHILSLVERAWEYLLMHEQSLGHDALDVSEYKALDELTPRIVRYKQSVADLMHVYGVTLSYKHEVWAALETMREGVCLLDEIKALSDEYGIKMPSTPLGPTPKKSFWGDFATTVGVTTGVVLAGYGIFVLAKKNVSSSKQHEERDLDAALSDGEHEHRGPEHSPEQEQQEADA